jgi:hypothetical protein
MATTLMKNLRICEESLRKFGCKEKKRKINKQTIKAWLWAMRAPCWFLSQREQGRHIIRQELSLLLVVLCLYLLLLHQLDAAAAFPSCILAIVCCSSPLKKRLCWFLLYCYLLVFVSSGFVGLGFLWSYLLQEIWNKPTLTFCCILFLAFTF